MTRRRIVGSVDYTLAKNSFGDVVTVFDVVLLVAILFSGVLPWAFGKFTAAFGSSVLAMAGFLFITGVALSIVNLPFAWYAQFKLEERFGFNTTTVKTWVFDRIKGLLLAVLLGYPVLALVLKLIEWTGANWWVWAAAVVNAFQLFLLLIAPSVLMPLFNKFTPLPEGSLRDRLFALAQRVNFPTRSIEVMDGSKRSRHSNAFFTGFGRFRKIVFFDTLIAQLTEPQLESVPGTRNRPLQGTPRVEVSLRFHCWRLHWVRCGRVAGASGLVLSRIWFPTSRTLCRGECRACDAIVCVARGDDQFLVFANRSYVVAPFRI